MEYPRILWYPLEYSGILLNTLEYCGILDVDPNLDVDVDPYCLLKNTPEYFRILKNTLELYTFLYINQENLRKTNVFQSQTPKQQDSTKKNKINK